MFDVQDLGEVRVLRMDGDENRFTTPFLTGLHEELESAAGAGRPLVLTGTGKFFSNGLHLGWLGSAAQEEAAALFPWLHRIFARLLTFPGPTAAAVNGHAFGAGAILAAAADVRVMRQDRGYFCFPEIDLGMTMTEEFRAVCTAKFSRASLLQAWMTGGRYGAADAQRLGFVDEVAPEADLVERAAALIAPMAGKDPVTMSGLKANLHSEALAVLQRNPA